MNSIKEIIDKKKSSKLSPEDLQCFVDYLMSGPSDKEVVSFAENLNTYGLDDDEALHFSVALANTGKYLSAGKELGFCVDKQSVGRVSDAVSVLLMSVLSCFDIKFVKVVDNAYGEHGNLFSRLKSISGFTIPTDYDEAVDIAQNIDVMLFDAKEIAPASKKLYDICKKENCLVEPIVLVTILANKIATGASLLAYDIKAGEGAVIDSAHSKSLAERLVAVSKLAGMDAVAIVTDLNWPISATVGFGLEIQEVKDILCGSKEYPNSSLITLAKEMTICALISSGKAENRTSATEMFDEVIQSGLAYQKFKSIVEYYGGKISKNEEIEKLMDTAVSYIVAEDDGYMTDIKLNDLYSCVNYIVGKDESYDQSAGLVLIVPEGVKVVKGQKLAKIFYSHDNKRYFEKYNQLKHSFVVSKEKPIINNLFYQVVV